MADGALERYHESETHVSNLATAALARRKVKLEADKQELENNSRKLFIQMAGGSVEDAKAAAEPLSARAARLASIAITAGDLDYAGKLSSVAARSAIADKNKLDLQLKHMDYAERRLAGVNDQASWQEVVAELDGADSSLLRIPYSPAAVERLRKGLISAKDKALIASRESTTQTNEVRQDLLKVQKDLAKAREANVKKRTELLGKNGGKPVKDPSTAALMAASSLIEKAYPEHPDKPEAALTISSRAQELRNQNPALGLMDSIREAFRESVEARDFQESQRTIPKEIPLIGGKAIPGSKKQRFVGEGKTVDSALAIPGTAKELVQGRYYFNDQGEVAIWTGKAMRLVGQKMTAEDRLNLQLEEESNMDALDELEEEGEVETE